MKYAKKMMVVPFTEQDYQNLLKQSDDSDQKIKQLNQDFIIKRDSVQPNEINNVVMSIKALIESYEKGNIQEAPKIPKKISDFDTPLPKAAKAKKRLNFTAPELFVPELSNFSNSQNAFKAEIVPTIQVLPNSEQQAEENTVVRKSKREPKQTHFFGQKTPPKKPPVKTGSGIKTWKSFKF